MVYLHHIATAVPETSYEQATVAEVMAAGLEDRTLQRLSSRVYKHSGIDKRHSVIRDLREPARGGPFFGADGSFKVPSTGERNALYTEAAKQLFSCAARRVLDACPGFDADDITHVITVSCTGFFAPGPDYFVVRDLGLAPATERYHVGFMGCYAALPALKMAQAFCQANPEAVVLVVSVELCTLHLRPPQDIDSVVATSVFADGGAAALVSARAPQPGASALAFGGFATTLTPEGESDMAWTIGDTGFEMVLSTYVPQLLEANIGGAVEPLLSALELAKDAVARWAVHPGGRAILDKVQSGLGVCGEKLSASRRVLRDYGNMSSATILFVLKALLDEGVSAGEPIYALAFGPGLTVESGLFRRV